MSKTKKGSNAQFTGTGKGLTSVGDYAYAYSGSIEVDNNDVTLLSFQTGKEVTKGIVQFYYAEPSNDKFLYTVKMNGLAVVQYQVFGPNDTNGEHLLSMPVYLVIPPMSLIECIAKNNENTNSRKQISNFTGRIYG
tara:strand:+ start:85 stop:492 length:408 start_codon:yes stop_codon:yes gene_type:complete